AAAAERRVTLTVDATDAPRHMLHARMTLPAAPGPLTLRYPKWIPGEHGPNGPIVDVAGLVIRAAGKPLAWRRDDLDLYAVHTAVPPGVGAVEVSFDYLAPVERESYSSGGSTTGQLVDLEWNLVVLYPEGVSQRDLVVTPRLTLPHGWKHGSALETARTTGDTVEFKPVTLETLVDSPVIAGAYFKSFALGPGGGQPEHALDVVADSEAALQLEPAHLEALKRLVVEAGALFGTRHYARYHFLLTLSDRVAHFGLEHHQSSDNRTRERFLVEANARLLSATLLPHEFTHSWNGKFRRPAGLAVDGFDKPMKGDLLWVYEGLTQYLGWVLGARSGLLPTEWVRDDLAATAALMDGRAGRQWRPLADTAVAAQLLHRSSPEYQSWRRAADYYPEGQLLWLEVDVALRQRSGGAKSIDDFCRAFHGGPNHGAEVKPYTLDDVVATLDGLVANDWRAFLQKRVDELQPRAPLGGVTGGGWKLSYSDKPNERLKALLKEDKLETLVYTLGFNMKEDGQVLDVVPGSLAAKAGLGPAMKVVAVNTRKLNKESFFDALKMNAPLELLVSNGDFYKTVKLDYRGGVKYPHLERDAGKPDLLEAITRPLQTSISPTK
ncbi:MAG: glycyl aminopeptidase, partial [Myxococcales bacterium]|nr:glycyl aminopeptidase [Myxococcales bacterium]